MYSHPPLARRIVRQTRPHALSVFSAETCEPCGHRGKYKSWSELSMQSAIKAVELGEISVRQAAEMYSVPRSTLHDRLTGKVQYGARPGPNPYLTREEEEELASFLIRIAKIGYPHTKKQVLAFVQRILESKGIHTYVTNG